MIGGKLGIVGAGNEAYIQALVDAGFDAAFDGQDPAVLLETLPGLIDSSLPAVVAA